MNSHSDLLRIEDLNVSFEVIGGQVHAVRNASLRVLPGKVTALVGESGSGKTVISQSVLGILPKNATASGRILFDDQADDAPPIDIMALPLDGKAIRDIRGARIGKIFQEPMTSLSPLHTVGNQISESLAIHTPLSEAERREKTIEMLDMVGFKNPARSVDMYPFELSGGMRQRAMIAMALICDPALLVADEPTTALDVTIQAQILGLLKDMQSRLNMAMLLITHDLGVVANIADEVVVIYRGKIVEAGPVETIFRSPSHPYLKGLLAAVPHFDMKPNERLKALREIPFNPKALIGRDAKSASMTSKDDPKGSVLLSVRNLSKAFTKRKAGIFGGNEEQPVIAVNNVGFDIKRGECLGLVGESGCGKTTVSKMLMRAVTPDIGSVTLHSKDGEMDVLAAEGDDLFKLRTKMQMIFQDPVSSLSPRMTVKNILSEPLDIHKVGTPSERTEKIISLLDAVGLGANALNRYPHSFSGGQRQRIGIARALALGPEIIICDEPVSALDVSVQAQVLNLLKDLQRELGLTYLFISHNLAVVDYVADRIAVMCAGEIVELAPREKLMAAPVHPYTKALLSAVPFADLDRPLDFSQVTATGAADRANWGEIFTSRSETEPLEFLDLGDDHMVLARPTAEISELKQYIRV